MKVLSIVFSTFPLDPRPRREADAMIEGGNEVDMICLKRDGQKSKETLYGVNVYRVNIKRKRESKLRYIWQYLVFFSIVFFSATRMHIKKRYDILHVHNMPDFLVFSALIPKLLGAKIILDLHDPMPELYVTKYGLDKNHIFIKFLIFIEKISVRFSDLVITPNKSFKELFIFRGCDQKKIHIVMNSPMEKVFSLDLIEDIKRDHSERNFFRIMYHGFIAEHNGLRLALDAISILKRDIPNLRFDIYGSGTDFEEIKEYADHLRLNKIVEFHGTVNQNVIAKQIVKSDLGIIPNLRTPFTDINFPTRIFEYLSLRTPVIAPRTRGILDYFDEGTISLFEPGCLESLVGVILEMWCDPNLMEQNVARGFPIYYSNRWEVQKNKLLELVQGMLKQSIQ